MIGFYLDSGLTRPVTALTPKRFLLQLGGDTQYGSLYLGDPYFSTIRTAAASGAGALAVDQTFEFPAAGSAIVTQAGIDTMTIAYTGTTGLGLTGVTGLTAAVSVGDTIRPAIAWVARGSLVFFSQGSSGIYRAPSSGSSLVALGHTAVLAAALRAELLVALGQPSSPTNPAWQTVFGVAGGPLITSITQILPGVASAVRVDLQVSSRGIAVQELTNWQVTTSSFTSRQASSSTPALPSDPAHTGQAPGYALIQNQALPQSIRFLPSNRRVTRTTPGFTVGEYVWRDETTINEAIIIPTKWDADTTAIGLEKFIDGIGCNDDLKPLDLIQPEDSDSIFLNVQDGTYFEGPTRYFLPGSQQLEFGSAYTLSHPLSNTPKGPAPIFVGTWVRDNAGFYSIDTAYRYQAGPAYSGTGLQFQINRSTNTLTLNQGLDQTTVFLGTVGGTGTDYFNLPIYPVWTVHQIYVDQGLELGHANCPSYTFDRDRGTLVVTAAPGLTGQPVYAVIDPAIAIQYETAAGTTRQLPVDLNPANSGLTGGYVSLRHNRPEAASVVLSCDKPLIDVPATYLSVIDLVAYGPVYFTGDYALINAKVFGALGGEQVAGISMQVVVDPTEWTGTLNYQNPATENVVVTTGADGTVSMIFVPSANWGFYIPPTAAIGSLAGLATTTIANDTLVLPEPIPISQVFDGTSWLATLYQVMDNDPNFGKIGAVPANGEIPWATTGTPGTPGYKTNGSRQAWGSSVSGPYRPIAALDAAGHNYTSLSFSGNVTSLVYGQAIPVTGTTGAFFITFLQRLLMHLEVLNSNVVSNSILLQMDVPSPITDNVWLVLNSSTNGQLNTFRLGYAPLGS